MAEGNAGLLQLDATGPQDEPLSGDPETTLFRDTSKRAAKYAHVWADVTRSETVIATDGTNDYYIQFTIPRYGDMLNCVQFEAQLEWEYLPNLFPGVPAAFEDSTHKRELFFTALSVLSQQRDLLGGDRATRTDVDALQLDKAALVIGNTNVSTLYGEYERFKGNSPEVVVHDGLYDPKSQTTSRAGALVRFRLDFGFSGSRSVPLVSLVYHTVHIRVKLRAAEAVSFIKRTKLLTSYVYLSTSDHNRFVQNTHEFVIQRTLSSRTPSAFESDERPGWLAFRLAFSHPTISIAFRVRDAFGVSLPVDYIQFRTNNPVLVGGHGFEFLCSSYADEPRFRGPFRKFSPDSMYVIKFPMPNAPEREALRPHGTLNMSRFGNTQLELKIKGLRRGDRYTLEHYQECTNLLRITGGMAGVAFVP